MSLFFGGGGGVVGALYLGFWYIGVSVGFALMQATTMIGVRSGMSPAKPVMLSCNPEKQPGPSNVILSC